MYFSGNLYVYPPVHALPSEILGHIFQLVLAGEPCLPRHGICPRPIIRYSNYPEFLSHVCSSWRQIAISLHELWVHIDLSPYQLLNEKLGPRVETYVSRSGQLPLYVHVHGSQDALSDLSSDPPAAALLTIATRIRTLDLSIREGYTGLCKRALGAFVDRCRPGVFTRLVVRNTSPIPGSSRFIMPENKKVHDPIHHGFSLAVSEEQLDQVFLPCTSLQLRGLFLPWTSKAYQGLVELRLSCPGARVEISEAQLLAVLRSSRQLRTLEFRISIRDDNQISSQEPVVLPKLQTLVAAIDHEVNLARLVRLIAPGPKSLDVSFQLHNNIDIFVDAPFADDIRRFFSRSNVRQLSVSRLEYSMVVHLLLLAPNVQTLVLEHCHWGWGSKYEVQLSAQTGHQLSDLHVINSSICVDDLLELIEAFRVQKLACWRYRPFQGGVEFTRGGLNEALREGECESYPEIEMFNSNPIMNSDLD